MNDRELSIKKNNEGTYEVRDKKENIVSVGPSYRACLKYVAENAHIEKPSFYVVKDLMTWATSMVPKSELEIFSTIDAALDVFIRYRKEEYNKEYVVNSEGLEYARLTLGAKIGTSEIDIVHVRNDKNYLVQDFQHSDVFTSNIYFIDALNQINQKIGLDCINVYRKPSREEIEAEIYCQGARRGLSRKEIETRIREKMIPKRWIVQLIKEVKEIHLWENDYLEHNYPKEKSMEYARSLAEKIYCAEHNNSLDAGFYVFLEGIKRNIEEYGYDATIGKMKDDINNMHKENSIQNEISIEEIEME